MNKKKEEVKEVKEEVKAPEQSAEMAAAVKAAEEKAYARVLKAAGLNEASLLEIEETNKKNAEMVSYDISPTVVRINGEKMPSKGTAPRAVAEQIMSMAGARRNRLMEEQLSKTSQIELIGGKYEAKIVEVTNSAGEKVSE